CAVPAATPGIQTTPRAPVASSVNAVGVLPSNSGRNAGDGVDVTVTPLTGCPPRVTEPTIDPDPLRGVIPFAASICENRSACSTGIDAGTAVPDAPVAVSAIAVGTMPAPLTTTIAPGVVPGVDAAGTVKLPSGAVVVTVLPSVTVRPPAAPGEQLPRLRGSTMTQTRAVVPVVVWIGG